jgi:hypothetical protein
MNKIKMMVLGIAAWYSMAGVSSGNGVEQGRDWASYKGIFNIFDKFYQIPEANRNHLGFRIRAYSNSKRVILEEVVLTIKSHEGDREVRFGPGGTFILPRDKELVTENPRIWTS